MPDSAVASVRCRAFRLPTDDGVAMSFAPLTHRAMVLVVVELEDGTRGIGESWVNFPSWAWRERLATVDEGIAPLLVGRRFRSPQDAHALLLGNLASVGRQWGAPGPIHQAVSAVDTAMWDIAARSAGVPLVDLLGGALRDELAVYGSSLGPTGVAASSERCLALGLTAVKVKLGFGADTDAANLRAARDAMGPSAQIFADANQAWSLDEATAMIPALRDARVAWLEEPLAGDRPAELAELRRRGGIPLATGENLYGEAAFRPYVGLGAVDIVQPDISKVGGPTEYLRVHALAHEAGITVNPHLYNGSIATAATLQVAAALPGTDLIEWDVRSNPMRAATDHLLTTHGTVRVPRGPGLGIDLDLSTLGHAEETA